MHALDDQHDLLLPEAMELVVGSAHMREHGQLVAVLVQQHGVVRRHELIGMGADEDPPGVLADEAADDRGIVEEVVRVMTHVRLLSGRRRPWSERQAQAWRKVLRCSVPWARVNVSARPRACGRFGEDADGRYC